jgi:MFS family permease
VHLRLFADRGFTGDSVVMGLVQFGLLGVVLYSSIYVQELLGFGPMAAGLSALPLILPLTLAAQVGGRWFDAVGVRAPTLVGMTLCTVGVVGWLVALPALSYPWLVPGMVLVGLGLGLTLSPTTTDALGRFPDAERSQASGVVQSVRQLGGTLGIAVIGGVVLGLGPDLPGRTGTAEAIATGFGVAAVAFALAALTAALLLRRSSSRPSSTASPHAPAEIPVEGS